MSALLQPGYLAKLTAGIAATAMLFPEQDRIAHVRLALDLAVTTAKSLLYKARSAEVDKREGVSHALERLGVEHPYFAASEIAKKLGRNRRSCVEHFLESCEYATAHQAIQAVTQVGLVEEALEHYEPARLNLQRAFRMLSALRTLRNSLDACKKYGRDQGRPMAAYVSRASDKIAKRLPGLVWCFETGRLREVYVASRNGDMR